MNEKHRTLAERARQAREAIETANGIVQPPRRMVRPDLWEDAWKRGYEAALADFIVAKTSKPESVLCAGCDYYVYKGCVCTKCGRVN